MTNRPIVKNPNDILRKKSERITQEELKTGDIQKLIDDLIDSMEFEKGIGLAAPQIGVHKRVIVVNDGSGAKVFVNPKIVSRSFRKGHFIEEGCLSIPGVWGYVTRNKKVRIHALNRHGDEVSIKAEGLNSIIFQHEIDHLDGILFIDKVDKYTRRPRM